MEHYLEFEDAVRTMAVAKIQEQEAMFARAGLTLSEPEIRRGDTSVERFTSELSIIVRDTHDIFDVVECLIFHEGQRCATFEEIETWLEDVFSSMLAGRKRP